MVDVLWKTKGLKQDFANMFCLERKIAYIR
jgi:hypothetical protein